MTVHEIRASDQSSRHRTVSIAASPFITVSSILAFAGKLRETGMPGDAPVAADHSHETRHFTGLRAHVPEALEEERT